ncbi:MAG TPA: thiamine-phosphate kinase [Xanthobacteraceae bacterium]|jgi:thiamine-monophosphate kinase
MRPPNRLDKTSSESGEDRLIAHYFRPLATHPGAFGLADDCAALSARPGRDLVLKADAIVGGVHFFTDDPADKVAQKALRVNLSDLAAKGARPIGFLLSLALPTPIDHAWLQAFATGLGKDANAFRCPLLGGDTDYTPGPVTISIAMVGTVPAGSMIKRSGARPGQRVCVTGTIGDAALGLRLRRSAASAQRWKLDSAHKHYLLDRYLVPQPRNAASEAVRFYAAAAMDISDGLAGDLEKLCRASGVSARIAVERIPLSEAARRAIASDPALIETALTGGDDYEILCTVEPERFDIFSAVAAEAGVSVTEIGEIEKRAAAVGARFFDRSRKPLVFERTSFSHF